MPLRPFAITFVIVCLTVAILLVVILVRSTRRRQWIALLLLLPALACAWLASLPIPYLLGLNTPHAVFNGPAPVPTSAVTYYLSNLSSISGPPPQPQLIAMQASTGKVIWQHVLPSQDTLVSADAGTAYAVSRFSDSIEVRAFEGATGSILWQRSLPGLTTWLSPQVVNDKLLLSALDSGSTTPQHLLALRRADGQQLWSVHVGLYDISAVNPLQLIPSPDSRALYDVPNASTLEARSISDGKLLWANTQMSGQVVIGADTVYEVAQFGSVTAFSIAALASQTGAPIWQFGDHDFFHAAAAAGDTLYVTAQHSGTATDNTGKLTNPETVYALDAHTGAVRWKYATQSADSGYLAVGPVGVFIKADDGIHALRPPMAASSGIAPPRQAGPSLRSPPSSAPSSSLLPSRPCQTRP
jgi:outer membrane protein assembly factor BamB